MQILLFGKIAQESRSYTNLRGVVQRSQLETKFSGPLFIIGAARSGTTMLRELLNTHDDICIPKREYSDLYELLYDWERHGDLSNFYRFSEFYNNAKNITSISLTKLHGNNRGVKTIDCKQWYNSCKEFTPYGILEPLYRYHVSIGQPGAEGRKIWGDKTPNNIYHINILSKRFHNAKFILLIRDPRDISLSLDKFTFRHYLRKIDKEDFEKAWKYSNKVGNKRLIIIAKRTCADILNAKKRLSTQNSDFIEIKYENILYDVDNELNNISRFLDIENKFCLENFQTPILSFGDAAGSKVLIGDNIQKYKKMISKKVIKTIDNFCGTELNRLGYETNSPEKTKEISPFLLKYYRISGIINILRTYPKDLGVRQTIWLIYMRYIHKHLIDGKV